MKPNKTQLASALAGAALFLTAGCESIKEYSVNSYQGVLPVGDQRLSGSMPQPLTADTPKPSTPETPPTAAPAAPANPAPK